MIIHENITYQDKSELIYQFLKQGKDLGEICNAIKTYLPELMFWERKVKFYMLNCITEHSWLFNDVFKFIEFVFIYTTTFAYEFTLNKIIINWVNSYKDYIVEYKEEYKKHIELILFNAYKDLLFKYYLDLLTIFQNYLDEDIITKLCSNGRLKNDNLKQILSILNKSHLYNHYIFIGKLKNK